MRAGVWLGPSSVWSLTQRPDLAISEVVRLFLAQGSHDFSYCGGSLLAISFLLLFLC